MIDTPVVTLGHFSVTLYVLLAVPLCLLALAVVSVSLSRQGWKPAHAFLGCLLSGAFGFLLGRGLYFLIRNEYFLDPMGRFVGLTPLFDLSMGGISAAGAIPGLFLGGWLTCKILKKDSDKAFDIAAVPGLLLFAVLCFIEPLSGQGYGPELLQPFFQWSPLGIQNGWGEWLLSVSFIKGLLLLVAAFVSGRFRIRQKGDRILCALVLMSCFLIIPESLRRDDILQIMVFVRVDQLGYAVFMILAAVLIWCKSVRLGFPLKNALREAALLLLAVLLLVAGEYSLDKSTWPDWCIYCIMVLLLAGIVALLLRRLKAGERITDQSA